MPAVSVQKPKVEIMELKDTGERLIVKENSQNDPNYIRHMAAYMFAVQFVKDKIILDAGSGSGYGAHYLAINGANKVMGVDQSEEAITYARSRYKCANLEFEIGGVISSMLYFIVQLVINLLLLRIRKQTVQV